METKHLRIAVVDDHRLYRKGLINLIGSLGEHFKVLLEAGNGQEFIEQLATSEQPDLVILDVEMPVMDGIETATYLQFNFPALPILVISMIEDEGTLIRMLKLGVKGYLSKDVEPAELKEALLSISQKGYYYTDLLTGKLILSLNADTTPTQLLNDRELRFIELCCSEYTYKEIADLMFLSPKTIDGYRAVLFEKLGVKSRVGLVLHAIKNGLFRLK
ncbi:MAG: DNA-binding response regulator [Bacteroidetes bacterium RIFCSPHIGHO2_02_FULL_44_7]|nr:MAG: DNA-binding response regulator [Bacteroidetes bacterium RIFCSPHIGHO2_02_FULL_44_7]